MSKQHFTTTIIRFGPSRQQGSSILESICLNILTFYAQWRSDFDLVFNMIDLSSEYNHKIDKVKTEICIYYECDICVQMFNYNNQFK